MSADGVPRLLPWIPLAAMSALVLATSFSTVNPLPPRAVPAPSEVQVVSGSTGAETDGVTTFWWLTTASPELRVSNNLSTPASLTVAGVLDNGPCDIARTVRIGDRTITLEPSTSAPFELTLPLSGYEAELVALDISGDPCDPVGSDPRALLVRLSALTVTST